jgi:hypothetical protein
MAYRFLLEVPEALADTANVAVSLAGDAQVVLVRPSHGLGIDDPYVDMTIAAQTLRVVDVLHTWYESLEAPRPQVRVLLHGGERHSLAEVDRPHLVALIRRDQPWVERSIPRVGDHEPSNERAGFSTGPGAPTTPLNGTMEIAVERPKDVAVGVLASPAAGFRVESVNYFLIQVNNLQRAEQFYQDFFAMELLGRLRRSPDGLQIPLPSDYSWQQALQTGELADTTFLSNGPLAIAAERVGLETVLNNGAIEMISIGVDARTFATIKGQVLMRPFTVLRSGVASFVFRDPLMVNWEVAVVGSVPIIPV